MSEITHSLRNITLRLSVWEVSNDCCILCVFVAMHLYGFCISTSCFLVITAVYISLCMSTCVTVI